MVRKFFPLDKNYVLEQAQILARRQLLPVLYNAAVQAWSLRHNPLGLDDTFTRRLEDFQPVDFKALEPFYDLMAGAYRFRNAGNQLAFLWDGSDHLEYYSQSWSASFSSTIRDFCLDGTFVQAVLDLTVFASAESDVRFSDARMQQFVLKRMGVRLNGAGSLVVSLR